MKTYITEGSYKNSHVYTVCTGGVWGKSQRYIYLFDIYIFSIYIYFHQYSERSSWADFIIQHIDIDLCLHEPFDFSLFHRRVWVHIRNASPKTHSRVGGGWVIFFLSFESFIAAYGHLQL